MRMKFIIVTVFFLTLLSGVSTASKVDFGGFDAEERQEYLSATAVLSVSSITAGESAEAALVVDIEEGWHINSAKPYQQWLIPATIEFDSLTGITVHSVAFPNGTDVSLAGEMMSVYDGRLLVRFVVTIVADVSVGEYRLPIHLGFQPCNDRECRAPQIEDLDLIVVVGADGEPIHGDIFGQSEAETTEPGVAGPEQAADEGDLQRLISKYGTWGYFLVLGVAFITGLLLSFSPCTYPMIPITVSVFAGQDRKLGRGFVLSLFYVGSMAAVYGIMGLVVSLVGGVFGAWLASPPVVIGIAVVFVIFSLSMFGLFELQVPSWLRQKLGAKATAGGVGVGSSIILGVIAALVVSPCVGPFVAGILLYVATSGSPLFGFLTLFIFALGLGTLFVIIATFSSAINALPGSGGWMESVKKFFGFVLLLMAIYFLRTIISPVLTAIITGLLLTAFGVFGGGLDRLAPDSGFFLRVKKFLGVLALLVGIYLLGGTIFMQGLILPPASEWLPAGGTSTSQVEQKLIDWETDMQVGLAQAKEQNKPVLIDTWATWCANCRVLEKETFGNRDVAAEAKRFVPIKVQLEKADTPATKEFMTRFGLRHYSLPTTLLLDSQGKVRRILQGVVSPADIIAEMKKVH